MFNFSGESRFNSKRSERGMNEDSYYSQYDIIAKIEVGDEKDMKDIIVSIASIQFYCGKSGSTTRCKITLRLPKHHNVGIGSTSGYGYNREIVAIRDAFEDMGQDISDIYQGESVDLHVQKLADALANEERVKEIAFINHAFV